MSDFLSYLFGMNFMPHGHCFAWQPDILWLHVLSDAIIALAYYSIPVALIYFVQHRKDLAFSWIFMLFGAFILLCGTNHAIAIGTMWVPVYRFEGGMKLLTALVSIGTAVATVRLLPQALALPSPAQLAAANAQLEIVRQQQAAANAALVQSNQDLKEFAYIVSHDLKAPLRAITSLASWIEDESASALSEENQEHLQLLQARAQRMDRLLDGVLAYSRVGRTAGQLSEVNSHTIVTRTIDALAPPATITVRVDGELPTVHYDETQLEQIFQNLIGNAITHMQQPSGSVVISCRATERDWEFCIADTGPGIPERHRERIFKIFQVLQRRDEREATGVGLAIVKRLVTYNGGSAWVESEDGQGSQFYFTVPKHPAQHSAVRIGGDTP